MGGLKAPGSDGFQGVFFQNFWEIISPEVMGMAANCLGGGACSNLINETHNVLVPKVPHPETVNQFRPISLCNYSYKVLSKILANRLKPFLPELISPNQNAFFHGRQIQDNIILAHEVFHFLKLRKAKHRFELGIKLDMNKAYDRVEWDFLEAVMRKMGFCEVWVSIIMQCVSSAQFYVLLNGQPGKSFKSSKGLRQGTLYPHIYFLLSVKFSRASSRGLLISNSLRVFQSV